MHTILLAVTAKESAGTSSGNVAGGLELTSGTVGMRLSLTKRRRGGQLRLGRLMIVLMIASASHAGAQVTQLPPIAKVDVPLDRVVDLSSYSTYAWNKSQVPVENLANHIRLINAIQKAMKDLGYRIDTVKPQLLIQYRVELRTAVQTRSTQKPSTYDPTDLKVQIELNEEEQVSLSIELVDAESKFLVWTEKDNYPLGTPDKSEKQINAAVADLFSRFPKPDEKSGKDEQR